MDDPAAPDRDAPVRLTHEQTQELILRTVATQAESLLRTAYRNSLCDDDAHDAYQRSMEIFLRRAPTLDPRLAHKWLHVVCKREAQQLRHARSESVAYEAVDFELQDATHVSTPEERAIMLDRAKRAGEALRRLKPQERRAMGLKAFGHSYAEIAEATGFSATKVNRALAEGRKNFLARFESIEAGAECERWQSTWSAMVSGEATAAQITEARPHLRNCAACRATLRDLHASRRPLKAVLPVGLVSLGAKVAGLIERLLPGIGGGDAGGAAAGGAGLLGVGGAKLAGLLAAGAVATGGGLVVAQEAHDGAQRHAPSAQTVRAGQVQAAAAASVASAGWRSTTPTRVAPAKLAARRGKRTRRGAVGGSAKRRLEFAPRGSDFTPTSPTKPIAKAARASAPRPVAPAADSTRGEFAPQP